MQKRNSLVVSVLVLLLELTSLAQGQQCSSTYQPIPGLPGRDGRDGNDGSPGRDGRDGSPAVFTHGDFLKLKEMLTKEGVCCAQNCSTPSPYTTVTETEYLTMNQTATSTQVVHSTASCPPPTPQDPTTMTTPTPTATPTPEGQRDCQEFQSNGFNQSGVYTIQPDSLKPFDVYCDMDTDGGGWTVFQRRQDGSVGFYRNWDNYTAGFGNLYGEYWLGLDYISRLTNVSSSELRIDLADFENQTRYAKYSSFHAGAASTKYVLTVSGYSGTAGDSFTYHSGNAFSTYDQDNDGWSSSCSITFKGAWWYEGCHYSNLNGLYLRGNHSTYADGVNWRHWKGIYYSLKFTEMKIRPSN